MDIGTESRERAAYVFRESVEEGLLQGRCLEAFASASVFVSLRERNYPITLQWLSECSFATHDEISGAYRALLSSFDLSVLPPFPKDFLPRIASKLRGPPQLERTAARILEQASHSGISQGKHTAGFAGAALYAATQLEDESLTQEAVAEAAGVSLVTICRRWQSIDEGLDLSEVGDL